MLTIGQCATLACLLEVTAPKPGNVHRGADFEDIGFTDFVASAVAIQPAMQAANQQGIGATIKAAIDATRQVTPTNTNLGIVLLLGPLASVPPEQPLSYGLPAALAAMGASDAKLVYEAIGAAKPGGLGEVSANDVRGEAPTDLLQAMRESEDRDMIARQYSRNYEDVFEFVLPELLRNLAAGTDLINAIVRTHVATMSQFPDTLIGRKCGQQIAQESAQRAALAVELSQGAKELYDRALADLDFWLRSDGHRRNPGATADLIAAALFVGLRDGMLHPPFQQHQLAEE